MCLHQDLQNVLFCQRAPQAFYRIDQSTIHIGLGLLQLSFKALTHPAWITPYDIKFFNVFDHEMKNLQGSMG